MKALKIPKKIFPCPIAEAIAEIRFQPKCPRDAVFGIAYAKLGSSFKKTEPLAILQLPEQIRNKDASLKFKPHHKLIGDSGRPSIQIGPAVISLTSSSPYLGWTEFSKEIKSVLEQLTEIIDKPLRLATRYVNFFEYNIYQKINLRILDGESEFKNDNILVKTIIADDPFVSHLTIANNATWKVEPAQSKSGSVIDIDTFTESPSGLQEIISAQLDDCHAAEKRIFFGLIKNEVIDAEMHPEY